MKAFLIWSVAALALLIGNSAIAGERAAAAPYNWTGLYVGVHGGWGWVGEHSVVVVPDPRGAFPAGFTSYRDRNGFLGGLQAGADWQHGNWVLGAEGDWSWSTTDATTSSNSPVFAGNVSHNSADDNWIATLTGRVGFAQDCWLLYAKGGAAWMNVDYGELVTGAPGFGTLTVRSASDTRSGWTVGGGIETALGSHWSAKLEYDYLDFGSASYFFQVTAPAAAAGVGHTDNIFTDMHVVKVGLNYRFDWHTWPIP
jgi:outer membrane immunogenic protein